MITLIKFLFIIIVLLCAFYLLFFKSKEKFKIIFEQDYKFKKYGSLNFFKNLILNIIYQSRISNFRTKLMHSSAFLGGVIFLFSIFLLFFNIKFYNLLLDISILLLLIGIFLALVRRYLLKVERIIKNSIRDNYFISLILLFLIAINSFFIQGIKFYLFNNEFINDIYLTSNLSFSILTFFINDKNIYQFLYNFLWLINNLLVFGFIYSLSKSKMIHMILAPISILTSDDAYGYKVSNKIEFIDLEKTEKFGIDNINDLNSRDLLEVFSCTECGRCQDACPAFLTNKPLSPKSIIVNLLEHYQNFKDKSIINSSISVDSIWSCTTCGACVNACPVFINPLSKIIRFRQNLVMDKSEIPNYVQEIFNSIEVREHPFKGTNIAKKQFLNKLKQELSINFIEDVKESEYLYFLGCATIYNERAQSIAFNLIKILKKLNINFAISLNETCTGDIARRTGNEYLFQLQANNNIENFKEYKFSKILVNCAHCFNTFKNEYSEIDNNFNYEVIHHSVLLSSLLKQGKIKLKREKDFITYHDACYLGRHNDIYNEPRSIVKNISDYRELYRNRSNSFCCGAGGGMYFKEDKTTKKINHERLEEVLKVKAKIVSTSCPYCLMMFEDAINSKGLKNQVFAKDIVELIEVD
jgi:Fe-S oxidoreductase